MHPTLARYLNLAAAADTLKRERLGQVLKAEERVYVEVAQRYPDRRALVLNAGAREPSTEAQQALLFLATHAAVGALREDAQLGGRLLVARSALTREGATEHEVDEFLAAVVLEEGFGDDEPAEEFDRQFLEDTLQEVPALAKLTRERVDALCQTFVEEAPEDWAVAHRLAARALVESAWSDGPQPVNAEHLHEALEKVARALSHSDEGRGLAAMRRFLSTLSEAGLVREARLRRLRRELERAELAVGTEAKGPPH